MNINQFIPCFNLSIAIILFLLFVFAGAISILEKQHRATLVSFLCAIIIPTFIVLPFFFGFFGSIYQYSITSFILVFAVALLYDRKSKKFQFEQPKDKIDERDVMFSRKELLPGTERYNTYYKNHPGKEALDDHFRKKPGLLNSKASFYNPYAFSAAKAAFLAVESLHPATNAKVSEHQQNIKPKQAVKFIQSWAKKLGAIDCGIALMKDYHFYSVKGRKEQYSKPVINNHKYGIAITVEMDPQMIAPAPQSPVVMESSQQYFHSGSIAVMIAAFIRELGYPAKAHIDGKYDIICPLVARDAGLGEIGRMGLLMTPRNGPRVRIAVVTTDIPLIANEPLNDETLTEFCTYCKKCAFVCPSKAISFDERQIVGYVKRWQINSEACFTYWCIAGTDCTRCMAACPYSHPDNLFHRMIRFGIKHSLLFRKMAVFLDDVFYGKKPKRKDIPGWIPKK